MSTQKPHAISTHNIKASPEIVWKFLTDPALLNIWWLNAEKLAYKCSTDLRVFGIFRTILEHKQKKTAYDYLYLEIIPNRKLTFTSALMPDLSPGNLALAETISFDLFEIEQGTRLVPDLKAKNFSELEAMANASAHRVWIYNLTILQKLAEQMQAEINQLKNQMPVPTRPVQP
jgi:uncharacterized protein YndB with AHSA1/START domain